MFKTREKPILYFDSNPKLFTQRCLPTKGVVEAFRNHPFFILATNTSTKKQCFDKHKVLERLNNKISTIISIGAAQK